MRKESPKEETYSKYGDGDRKFDIDSLVEHCAFSGSMVSGIPVVIACLFKGYLRIQRGNEPLKSGYTKTDAYVGGNRKLGDRFPRMVLGFSGPYDARRLGNYRVGWLYRPYPTEIGILSARRFARISKIGTDLGRNVWEISIFFRNRRIDNAEVN